MDDCVFCKIVKDELPSQMVYTDDKVVAFLSTQPIRPGHLLVIPKNHVPNFYDLSESDYSAVMGAVQKLAQSLMKVYRPKKVGVLIAGWEVPHTHVHVVPMYESGDLTSKRLLDGTATKATAEELIAEKKKILGN